MHFVIIKVSVFRFHTGSIKSLGLERRDLRLLRFRFHTGSIKSKILSRHVIDPKTFRFHTGSIKSHVGLNMLSMHLISFDSILVRLKGDAGRGSYEAELSFDSILVRLKDMQGLEISNKLTVFRFHTGSIKSLHTRNQKCPMLCFDSILVRLKAGSALRISFSDR